MHLFFQIQAVTLFNKQLANNDKLRSEIDHLRQERAVFDNLYKKLAHELDKSKQAMSEFIRDSTEAFEQRWAQSVQCQKYMVNQVSQGVHTSHWSCWFFFFPY